jgi:hypothetical protein
MLSSPNVVIIERRLFRTPFVGRISSPGFFKD